MSEEQIVYYSNEDNTEEVSNNWDEVDDGLTALMHAAADADARDNQVSSPDEKNSSNNYDNHNNSHNEGSSNRSFNYYEQKDRDSLNNSRKRRHDSESEDLRLSDQRQHQNDDQGTSSSSRKRKSDSHEEPGVIRLKTDEGYIEKTGHANVVAEHYNTLKEKGLDERLKSRIFYMRNFNNWIKSMLINEYLNKIKGNKQNHPVRVLDMCCGKGGDLLKWKKGNITHLICTDIASVSLEQCESRYKEMCSRSARERNAGRIYKAEFIPADCTRVHLRKNYADPSIKLDLVSCQFAFHYSFESMSQAECMLKNAAECLQPGGFLIGTIPDANEIMSRQRTAKSNSFGNDVYNITFLCNTEKPPLFGAKYNFHLDGVVDCPEFLVHFPLFVKLARRHGLQLVNVERFDDFYHRMKDEGNQLLQKMQSFETYPPFQSNELLGTAENDYKHCQEYLDKKNSRDSRDRIGSLSKSEWEAASLYLTFAFKKAKTTWDSKGKPIYEFDDKK